MERNNFFQNNKKGQVTIFIILGIIIIVGVIMFLWLRGSLSIVTIPASIQPAYSSFISCIEDKTSEGIAILEKQGGYIQLPDFEPGNMYMPFSSQLNFFGTMIPYWYYISGNNIQKTQIPTKTQMQESLADYINNNIQNCNYEEYYSQGFDITQSQPSAKVTINSNDVSISISMNMVFNYKEETVIVKNHKATVKSKLGSLYDSAKKVYDKEQKELFLENYSVDTLRTHAPVDGTELTCSPKIWNADEVFSYLRESIEANTLALHTESPKNSVEKYFYVKADTGNGIRFITSQNWSNSYEVNPTSDGSIMIANPVGTQQGLGILGFCYIAYHFIYNIKYPVVIQAYSGDEIFQFPMAIVIQGNKPRKPVEGTAEPTGVDLCSYKNTMQTVSTYNTNLNIIPSTVSFRCLGQTCLIGNSTGTLTANFPQCSNGYILARANGYQDTEFLYSTVSEGNANVIMNRLYELNVNLKLNGQNYNSQAMIYFTSKDNSKTVLYPQNKKVNLTEGDYAVSVYIYRNSSISLPQTTRQECTEVPSAGIGGLFGFTQKKCFDITIPSQIITSSLAGGGNQDYYFFESDLSQYRTIEINANSFKVPTNLEDLQKNYADFDTKSLEVILK
jgi:hypothetical protein